MYQAVSNNARICRQDGLHMYQAVSNNARICRQDGITHQL